MSKEQETKNDTRGKIRNESYSRQQIRWETMKWGNITPTDIDSAIDFQNKLFVFIEVKHESSDILLGQRILLERICSHINSNNVVATALVGKHNISPPDNINLEECILDEYWYNGCWIKTKKAITIDKCIEILHKKYV